MAGADREREWLAEGEALGELEGPEGEPDSLRLRVGVRVRLGLELRVVVRVRLPIGVGVAEGVGVGLRVTCPVAEIVRVGRRDCDAVWVGDHVRDGVGECEAEAELLMLAVGVPLRVTVPVGVRVCEAEWPVGEGEGVRDVTDGDAVREAVRVAVRDAVREGGEALRVDREREGLREGERLRVGGVRVGLGLAVRGEGVPVQDPVVREAEPDALHVAEPVLVGVGAGDREGLVLAVGLRVRVRDGGLMVRVMDWVLVGVATEEAVPVVERAPVTEVERDHDGDAVLRVGTALRVSERDRLGLVAVGLNVMEPLPVAMGVGEREVLRVSVELKEGVGLREDVWLTMDWEKEVMVGLGEAVAVPVKLCVAGADGVREADGLRIRDREWLWEPVPDPEAVRVKVREGASVTDSDAVLEKVAVAVRERVGDSRRVTDGDREREADWEEVRPGLSDAVRVIAAVTVGVLEGGDREAVRVRERVGVLVGGEGVVLRDWLELHVADGVAVQVLGDRLRVLPDGVRLSVRVGDRVSSSDPLGERLRDHVVVGEGADGVPVREEDGGLAVGLWLRDADPECVAVPVEVCVVGVREPGVAVEGVRDCVPAVTEREGETVVRLNVGVTVPEAEGRVGEGVPLPVRLPVTVTARAAVSVEEAVRVALHEADWVTVEVGGAVGVSEGVAVRLGDGVAEGGVRERDQVRVREVSVGDSVALGLAGTERVRLGVGVGVGDRLREVVSAAVAEALPERDGLTVADCVGGEAVVETVRVLREAVRAERVAVPDAGRVAVADGLGLEVCVGGVWVRETVRRRLAVPEPARREQGGRCRAGARVRLTSRPRE